MAQPKVTLSSGLRRRCPECDGLARYSSFPRHPGCIRHSPTCAYLS